MGKLKKSVKEATRLLGKVITFPERKTNSASQASAALFSAAKSGNADSILNLSDAVRSQWRFLAFELAAGPGSSPMCMGPALCADVNVEVQSQESLLTSESVLEHILNATTNKGKTVLSEAATNGHAHVVELLLQLGSNPQIADRLGGRTPLHYACFFGKSAAISALLDNLPDRYQRNPSSSGRNPGNNGRYVETRTLSGFTALHYCCAGGNVEALHTLLQYEPNIYAASEHASWEYKLAFSRGSTPLHILAAGALLPAHCMALVSELLRYYAEHSDYQDPRSMRDSKGMVPWQVAAATPAPRCAQALSVREQLLRLLHPSTNLHQFFDPSTLVQRRNCVATLASLAASALREALLQQIQEQQQLLEHMRFNDVYKSDPDACSSRASHPIRCDELAFVKEIGDRAHRGSSNGNEDNEDNDHNDCGHDHDVCSRSNSSSSSWSSERWSSNSGSTMASSRLPSYVCTPRNVLLQQQQLTPSQLQQQHLSALGTQLQRLPRGAGAALESGQPSRAETLSVQGDSVQGNSVVGHSEAASTVCELCMEEEVSRLFITSCQHKVCANCAVSLVQHLSTAPVGCPYCRIPIGGFAAICSGGALTTPTYLPMPWAHPLQPSSDAPGSEAGAPAARMPPNFSTKSMPAAALRARDCSSASLPSAVGARESTHSAVSLPPPPSQSSFSATAHKESAPHVQISCSEQLPPQQGVADADLGDVPRLRKYSDMSLQREQQAGSERGSGHVRKMSTMSLPAKKNKPDTKAAAASCLRKDSTKSLPQRRDKEAKADLVPSFLSMASPPMQHSNDIQVKASHKRNYSTKSLPPLLDNPDSEAASAVPLPNFASMSLPQMSTYAPFRTRTIGVA